MYLSDKAIYSLAQTNDLIKPFDVEKLQPCSYDLTLDNKFLRIRNIDKPIDPTKKEDEIYYTTYRKLGEDFLIMPGEFMLASTVEKIRLPKDVGAKVQGKSSLGRLGLSIQNAGHIDPGFEGNITLELHNASPRPIKLNFVERIGQIIFTTLTGSAGTSYKGKYQGQRDVTGSRSELDYKQPPNVAEDM